MNDSRAAALQVLRDNGLLVDAIQWDTPNIVRCGTVDKPHSQNGRYRAHNDSPVSLWWENMAESEPQTWTAKGESTLTQAERETLRQRVEQARLVREAETLSRHTEAAQKAQQIYSNAPECHSHPYLKRKGVSTCQGLLGSFLFFLPKSSVGSRNVITAPMPDQTSAAYRIAILHVLNTPEDATNTLCLPVRGLPYGMSSPPA